MIKKLLAVFAHPDDEAFGPGGTLARCAAEGAEIHLLCATRGEAGKSSKTSTAASLGLIREKELIKSARILGTEKVEFLDFIDGTLSNSLYHKLAEKIIKKIDEFKPQILVTTERLGISGHLDHIAVSMVTTYSYRKANHKVNKLYYYCLPKERRPEELDDYFIYFPEGYEQKDITTRIDFTKYWDQKEAAMKSHRSQMHDVKRILARWANQPKIDHFILQSHREVRVHLPETDLFAGISG